MMHTYTPGKNGECTACGRPGAFCMGAREALFGPPLKFKKLDIEINCVGGGAAQPIPTRWGRQEPLLWRDDEQRAFYWRWSAFDAAMALEEYCRRDNHSRMEVFELERWYRLDSPR